MEITSDNRKFYRPEIDGLRAIAVISIIIYHLNEKLMPSGYLGVDIFFVISGYVITSSLVRKKSSNFFQFIINFYERRVRRIFPALVFFVLIFSILICFFNPFPGLSLFTGIASLFGVSNFYLIEQSKDYFAQTTQLNVFTHTWSLGVEEQFYFVYPLLIWFSGFSKKSQNGNRNFLVAIIFLTTISLIYFLYLYGINQTITYYAMPTRFWEIASGCLLFFSIQKRVFIIKSLEKIPSFISFFSIFGVFFIPINKGGVLHLLIVCLTSMLIISLRKETFLFNILTNSRVIKIGLISYSLYLWHWGVLSISNWTIGIHWWSIPFQLALIYYLGLFSYEYVETPFRKNILKENIWKTFYQAAIALFFSLIALVLLGKPFKGKLFLGKISNYLEQSQEYYALDEDKEFCPDKYKKFDDKGKIRFAQCFVKNKNPKNRTLFFVGDSHNFSLLPGAELIAKDSNRNLYYAWSGIFPMSYKGSEPENTKEEILKTSQAGDAVFITIRYPSKFINNWIIDKDKNKTPSYHEWLNSIDTFSKSLSKKNVTLVLSTPTPEWQYASSLRCESQNIQWFNRFSKKECSEDIDYYSGEKGKYKSLIKNLERISFQNNNLFVFDALGAMCINDKCNFDLNKKLLYWDSDHVSYYGARNILGPKIKAFLKKEKIINFKNK